MMITEWLNGLTNEEAARLDQTLKNSKFLLDRLHTVVSSKIKATDRVATNNYDSPSWAYKAADREGYIRALNEILLLTKENPLSARPSQT